MIEQNITIADLVRQGLMRKPADYVERVVRNCYRMYQERGWKGEHVRVRIGRTGNGANPHYTIEYVSDDFDLSKPFTETRFDKREGTQQFSGQNHQKKAIGFDGLTWSTATVTLAELEDIKKRLTTAGVQSR